jgi:hypothetical protein
MYGSFANEVQVFKLKFKSDFMLYFEQSLMQLLWQHFMASLLYPKVFFDSWIIGPVRNSSTSFGVGLLRIYAESCDVSVSENKEKLTLVILLTDDIVLRN